MLNKWSGVGRTVREPEVKSTANGTAVTTFTIAIDRPFKNQSGEKEADFIPCVVWNKLAEVCGKYLKKGLLVAVSGRIQTRSYDASDGTKRYITEIVADEVNFLERAKDGQAEQQQGQGGFKPMDNTDDPLPF